MLQIYGVGDIRVIGGGIGWGCESGGSWAEKLWKRLGIWMVREAGVMSGGRS